MKLAIIDIETTGLNPHMDAIVEIGIVVADTETFETEVLFNKIVKDSNGITAPQLGLLVDSFSGSSVADVLNPDYFAAIDQQNQQLKLCHATTYTWPPSGVDTKTIKK